MVQPDDLLRKLSQLQTLREMTKIEFLQKIPSYIDHPSWGWSDLEVIVQKKELKGVCYRNAEKLASYGTYGKTWKEVYDKLMPYLIEQGHVRPR